MNAQKDDPQELFFMQDNAKAHYAAATRQDLQERQI
jgi:hypothetical protein